MPYPGQLVAALLGVRVARSLHGRWRRLAASDRDRLGPLAHEVRERALDLRGTADPATAGRELQQASERLADAMVESAESDPEVSAADVEGLREDLSRELDRIASADIAVSRGATPESGVVPTHPGRHG